MKLELIWCEIQQSPTVGQTESYKLEIWAQKHKSETVLVRLQEQKFCSLPNTFCALPTKKTKIPLRELTHTACCFKGMQNLISHLKFQNLSQLKNNIQLIRIEERWENNVQSARMKNDDDDVRSMFSIFWQHDIFPWIDMFVMLLRSSEYIFNNLVPPEDRD